MRMPLSILDLAPIARGQTASDSFANSVALAQRAEELGYLRVWYAEHHNIASIASSATSVLIAYVGAHTQTIRLGSGGVMLPNHAPLLIAEQFGALAAMYPGRIDLGLGRAPGSDQNTMYALRRDPGSAEAFPQDVLELRGDLTVRSVVPGVPAVPGEGSRVTLYILGSSLFGAQLAAALGLPYAFASHFAPAALMQALQVYRDKFEPSAQLQRPYAMVGVNVVAAETDAKARRLFTSAQQAFTNLLRGTRGRLRPPIDDIETYWTPPEKARASNMLTYAFVGARETVRAGLEAFIARTGADELMVASAIFDHGARLRSYEI